MPTLGDIANDAKALLEKIDVSTAATKTNTASIDAHVVQLITTNQAGFTNLAQGMALQIQLQKQTNDLLELNTKQNDTIICWLQNIAAELCTLVHNSNKEIVLQTHMQNTLYHLDSILELVHAREAIEVERRDELESKMEKCCPEKETPPKPCYEACAAPVHPQYRPIDTKWEPVRYNDNKPK